MIDIRLKSEISLPKVRWLNCMKWLNYNFWGCSSVGRAVRSQRTGQRFDPAQLHKPGPTQYAGTQPRQVRKEAAVSARNMCRGSTWLLFIDYRPDLIEN